MTRTRNFSKPMKDTKLYDLLGLQPQASADDIKRAYKKAALHSHPDRNPDADPEKFKEISRAYEILKDPEQRQIYDEYGEDGLNDDDGEDMGDLFGGFFGFGGQGGRRKKRRNRERRKGETSTQQLEVSLEDFFNGKTIKLALTKDVLCPACNGKGSPKEGAVVRCASCNGQGVKMGLRQLGPGMVQQVQTRCGECMGTGEIIDPAFRCTRCYGQKTVEQKKVLECHVEKGMTDGQKITFREEGDQSPDTDPGDVVLVLSQSRHRLFKRDGSHLYITQKISLQQALCGFEIDVPHFNGSTIKVRSEPGEHIITEGVVKKIPDEGMPVFKRPYIRGHLYVKFSVVFPNKFQLKAMKLDKLRALLPGPGIPEQPVGDYTSLQEFDPNDVDPAKLNQYKDAAREDDDDGGDGAQRVQCAQQ